MPMIKRPKKTPRAVLMKQHFLEHFFDGLALTGAGCSTSKMVLGTTLDSSDEMLILVW